MSEGWRSIPRLVSSIRCSGLGCSPLPFVTRNCVGQTRRRLSRAKVIPIDATPPVNINNLFRHPDAHPLVLDLMMVRQYGADWLEWDPETLEVAIAHDFSHVDSKTRGTVSDINLGKINACKTLHLVDSFWERWEVFTWCAMPFNGLFPDFVRQQVPTVGQVLVAVDIANRIREDSAWSTEVIAFIRTVYQHDGMLVPLAPADFFTIDPADLGDEVHEIDLKWPEVRASGKDPVGDTMVAEQLRRMLHVHKYLEESRDRFRKQMELVPHV